MTRLILLDRDGVINQDSETFVKSVQEFVPLAGALEAMVDLHRAGFKLAVCTNQSGVGRGLLSEAILAEIHADLLRRVQALGGHIDALRYCPHLPDAGCECRKPAPGMLRSLMAELGEAPRETVMVGDSRRDLEAARAAGCRAVLVRTGNGTKTEPDAAGLDVEAVYDDLRAFAEVEIARHRRGAGA